MNRNKMITVIAPFISIKRNRPSQVNKPSALSNERKDYTAL